MLVVEDGLSATLLKQCSGMHCEDVAAVLSELPSSQVMLQLGGGQ